MITTPCQQMDPDDWFIGRDGKQYPSDEFLTDEEKRAISRAVLPIEHETAHEHQARVDSAIRAATANRRRAALIRRRKAKEACLECPMRTLCLSIAFEEGHTHGTWGGYYEEELKVIRDEIRKRGDSDGTKKQRSS